MKLFFSTFLLTIMVLANGCQSNVNQVKKLPQDRDIKVYFNHRETAQQYTDPYRQVERSGDNLEAIIIQAITESKFSIDLAVQELQLPEIALALAQQAAKGVKVRIILDNKYSRAISDYSESEIEQLPKRERDRLKQNWQLIDLDRSGFLSKQEVNSRDALAILANANIPVIDDTADGSKGSGLMHHKFMVIDGKTIIAGSTNFTLSGIHGDFSNLATKGNVNHLVVINNQQIADLFTEEFNYMWEEKIFGLNKIYRNPQSVSWDNSQVIVQFSPTSRSQNWSLSGNGLIGKILENTRNSLNLALFVFSDQKLVDLIQDKQKQGVTIKALIDREFIFRDYSEALDMLGVALSKDCRYEEDNNPWQKPIQTVGTTNLAIGDKLHHKVAIIDDETVITGSQNWSAAANYTNDETVLVIKNKTVAQHFTQEFQRLYQNSTLGLPDNIKQKIKKQEQKCN